MGWLSVLAAAAVAIGQAPNISWCPPGSRRGYLGTDGSVHAATGAFAYLDEDGAVHSWGRPASTSGAPTVSGFSAVFPAGSAFAALKAKTGELHAWGNPATGGSGAPAGTGFARVYSCRDAFIATKPGGELAVWGYVLAYRPPRSGVVRRG